MLAARLTIVQVLDAFEVQCAITEFSPGREPEHTTSKAGPFLLEAGWEKDDALSTVISLISLWSEETNSH